MRRQLVSVVTASMALVLIGLLVPVLVLIRSNAESAAEATGQVLAQAVASSLPAQNARTLAELGGSDHTISVFRPDGSVLGPPSDRTPEVDRVLAGELLTVPAPGGRAVLVPVATEAGVAAVRVLVTDAASGRGVAERSWLIVAVTMPTVVVGAALALWVSGRIVRAAGVLVTTADRLAAGDLAARAQLTGPPELRIVGDRINLLAVRIDQMLDRQRRTAADLAHRLRTPLAALRLDVDGLEAAGAEASAARRLTRDVDLLASTVDAVIRSSRWLDADGTALTGAPPEPVDLLDVVGARLRLWSVLAGGSGRSLTARMGAGPLHVAVRRAELESAIDSLIGNAFTHTPAGVAVVVFAGRARDGAEFIVDDAGPGLGDPGVLRRGRSGGSSTGLGLDIARRVADSAGGGLQLGRSPQGGARVRLTFAAVSPRPTTGFGAARPDERLPRA